MGAAAYVLLACGFTFAVAMVVWAALVSPGGDA